jgi:hypothetical protein
MDAISIPLAAAHAGYEAVPLRALPTGQLEPLLTALVIEKTKLHAPSHLRKDAEVRA